MLELLENTIGLFCLMIQFHNISKQYPGGYHALTDVSFNIEKGEMVFITGRSGAGKSTLLKLIPVIEKPTRGQILFEKINLRNIRNSVIPYHRRQIGMIYQNNLLLNDRTVFQNIAMPLEISGQQPREIKKRVHAALEKVNLLSTEKKLPLRLSSGEQQRVGIARAIVSKPKVILADEPTGNLDPDLSLDIINLLIEFNQVGVTVLLVSHDTELSKRFAKRILILDKGQLIEDNQVIQ